MYQIRANMDVAVMIGARDDICNLAKKLFRFGVLGG